MTPEYLYHYTSIETLAMILSSKKIKFSALSQVDDLDEGKNQDFAGFAEYLFVSCWTDLEEESLPFWNMYTPNMRGVRIKMPSDFFKSEVVNTYGQFGLKQDSFISIVPQEETFQKDHWVTPTANAYLKKVEYTNDNDKLFPKVEDVYGDKFSIKLGKIGVCKSEHWKFQSEWRYMLRIFPIPNHNAEDYEKLSTDIISESIISMRQGSKLPFSYYFVAIDEVKFEQMEICLDPKSSESERLIVESLVNCHNTKAQVKISNLYKKIR